MKVFVVFHTFANGHQIDVFRREKDAMEHAAGIAMEYVHEDAAIDPHVLEEAKAAYENDEFDKVSNLVNVPEIDNHCNLEILEKELS